MYVLVSEIKRAVKIILDENQCSDALLEIGDIDQLAMDEIIEQRIAEGVKHIEMNAPLQLLEGMRFDERDVVWEDEDDTHKGKVEVILPKDFMRLVSFQMNDWAYPVSIVIGEDDPLYAQQCSKFAGIRGTAQKPVVAIVQRPEGLVLEGYSCREGKSIKRALYRPIPHIHAGEMIEVSTKLVDACCNYIAYLVATSYSNINQAYTIKKQAYDLASIETNEVPQQQENNG